MFTSLPFVVKYVDVVSISVCFIFLYEGHTQETDLWRQSPRRIQKLELGKSSLVDTAVASSCHTVGCDSMNDYTPAELKMTFNTDIIIF